MSEEFRRFHRIMTFIPAGIHFVDAGRQDGWGRIRNLSIGGLELETHFLMRSGQKFYLTFDIEGFYRFAHVPARAVRVRDSGGTFNVGVSFDEALDREHLREAIVHMVNRAS